MQYEVTCNFSSLQNYMEDKVTSASLMLFSKRFVLFFVQNTRNQLKKLEGSDFQECYDLLVGAEK